MNSVTTAIRFCVPSSDWSRPRSTGASLVGAFAYPLAGSGIGVAKHAQKRFTMAGTDIDGWPLGPWDGTSG